MLMFVYEIQKVCRNNIDITGYQHVFKLLKHKADYSAGAS